MIVRRSAIRNPRVAFGNKTPSRAWRIPPAELRSDVAAACADVETAVADLHGDRVPPAVFRPGTWIAQVVLSAQLVGDACGGAREVAEIAHDLRTPAGVVGDLSERTGIQSLSASASEGSTAADRRQ